MKKSLLIFNLSLLHVYLFAQINISNVLPKVENAKILKYNGFQVLFDTLNCTPVCSAYFITKAEIAKPVTQVANTVCKNDASVLCLKVEDYKDSLYMPGLLTPAIDLRYSEKAEQDCYYITNTCAQKLAFNAGIWERLERQTRAWVTKYDSLIVISGPVIGTFVRTGKLNVPKQFYKIIYSVKYNRGIAFLLNVELPVGSIYRFDMSIQQLNEAIHLQYFSAPKFAKRRAYLDREFWN
jgi:endonuclease G, mitochondrial